MSAPDVDSQTSATSHDAGSPETMRVAMRDCVVPDKYLRPIPPLDDPDTTGTPVEKDLEVPA